MHILILCPNTVVDEPLSYALRSAGCAGSFPDHSASPVCLLIPAIFVRRQSRLPEAHYDAFAGASPRRTQVHARIPFHYREGRSGFVLILFLLFFSPSSWPSTVLIYARPFITSATTASPTTVVIYYCHSHHRSVGLQDRQTDLGY